MKRKCILTIILACIMVLAVFCVRAEEIDEDEAYIALLLAEYYAFEDTITYQGGVVEQGSLSGIELFSSDGPLELAYALANSPYIVLDSHTVWDVVISGGTKPYKCQAILAYQGDMSLDPYKDSWKTSDWFYVEESPYQYTFTMPGRYFWEFRITDAAGRYMTFQTRLYETYTKADETNDQTVAGKINSIIASEITPTMSDYARARALHDWLINKNGPGCQVGVAVCTRRDRVSCHAQNRGRGNLFGCRDGEFCDID